MLQRAAYQKDAVGSRRLWTPPGRDYHKGAPLELNAEIFYVLIKKILVWLCTDMWAVVDTHAKDQVIYQL